MQHLPILKICSCPCQAGPKAFAGYAATSIKANRRFANLDGLSFLFINLFVVIVYWLSGSRIGDGVLQIGDITAIIGYALMVLYFFMMAQMVILTMPRALERRERVRAVLEHTPEIQDMVDEDPKTNARHEEVLAFRDVSFRFADAEEDTRADPHLCAKRADDGHYRRYRQRQIHSRFADPPVPRCHQRFGPAEWH